MKIIRNGLLIAMMMVSQAWADGEVEVYQSKPLIADGETSSIIQLWVPTLVPEDKLKVSASGGKANVLDVSTNGVVTIRLRPRKKKEETKVTLRLRVKDKLDESVSIPVRPAVAAKLLLSFSPKELSPEQNTAKVLIQTRGYTPMPSLRQRIALQTTQGEISEIKRLDDGNWEATYTVPDSLTKPTAVLFSAIDLSDPENVVGMATLPVRRKVDLTFSTPANAEVSLELQEKTYGPYSVKNDGKAMFDVDLHPNQLKARLLITTAEGKNQKRKVDVDGGGKPQMDIIAPLNQPFSAYGQTKTWFVTATDKRGAPISKPSVATIGAGEKLEMVRPGLFKKSLTAPKASDSAWMLEAKINQMTDSTEINLFDALPSFSSTAEPAQIDQKTRKVNWTVTDGGDTKYNLDIQVLHGRTIKKMRPQKKGQVIGYSGSIRPNGGQALAIAGVKDLATGLPAVNIRLIPLVASVPTGSEIPMLVTAEDPLGLPVPNVNVQLLPLYGDGIIANKVSTGPDGVTAVLYKAGDREGPTLIAADSGYLTTSVRIDQYKPGNPLERRYIIGDQADAVGRAKWRKSVGILYVQQDLDVGPAMASLQQLEENVAYPPKSAVQEKPAKKKKVRSTSTEVPFEGIRARSFIGYGSRDYTQSSDNAGTALLAEAKFSSTHVPLGLNAEAWFWNSQIGATFDMTAKPYQLKVGESTSFEAQNDIRLVGKYRMPFSRFMASLGLGYNIGSGQFFSYANNRTSANVEPVSLSGVSLHAGVSTRLGDLSLRTSVSEVFAKGPVSTQFEFDADYDLQPLGTTDYTLVISMKGGFGLRHYGFSQEDEDVTLSEVQMGIMGGAGLRF